MTTVQFGTTITEIGQQQQQSEEDSEQEEHPLPIVNGKPYDLVIVANGGFSSLRKYVLPNSHEPQYAGYIVWRGSIPVKQLPDPSLDYELEEGVYKDGIYDTIVLKMAKDNGDDLWTFGSFIATPEQDVSLYWDKTKDGASRQFNDQDEEKDSEASIGTSTNDSTTTSTTTTTTKQDNTAIWFRQHFQRHFGHVPGLVPLVDAILHAGDLQPHPQYEFGNIDTVSSGRILLLGDAAHMASPRTAVGAHTAIMDALALREAFDKTDNGEQRRQGDEDASVVVSVDQAIARYNTSGVQRAQELYRRSRQVSQQFVPY